MRLLAASLLACAALLGAPAGAHGASAGPSAAGADPFVQQTPAAQRPQGGARAAAGAGECVGGQDVDSLRDDRAGRTCQPCAPAGPAAAPRGGGRTPGWRTLLPGALR